VGLATFPVELRQSGRENLIMDEVAVMGYRPAELDKGIQAGWTFENGPIRAID
jgi:hypothetical protein